MKKAMKSMDARIHEGQSVMRSLRESGVFIAISAQDRARLTECMNTFVRDAEPCTTSFQVPGFGKATVKLSLCSQSGVEVAAS